MSVRICDLVASFVLKNCVDKVFMVSGGGLLYLTDGLRSCQGLDVVCCHHEQAASMAAVGYAKYEGIGCAYVTTGCGGTNAVTGVLHAWQDSVPCIFISGQCKRKETIRYRKLKIRQLGVQEADIVTIVESITKYAVMIEDAKDILYELEKAVYYAKEGRPGPVWIDIPMDIQSAWVNEEDLRHFITPPDNMDDTVDLVQVVKAFANSQRPIILAGGGIRQSQTRVEFQNFVEKHHIPFVCSRMGMDVLPTTHPLNIGRIGNKGTRAANFAIQNADFVLVLGSRLSVSSTGQEYEYFARNAKVYVVDIDEQEHQKGTVRINAFFHMHLQKFFKEIVLSDIPDFDCWAERCLQWRERYPVCLPEYYDSEEVNLYAFIEKLSEYLKADSVIVSDAGSAVYVPPQGLKTVHWDQRYITSGAQAEMGFSLPGAIGVSAAKKGEVWAITGDGSLQMNIQELQTIKYYNYPVKLFVWNNNGYLSIRASQGRLFNGKKIGTDATNGISFPDIEKIASAYGIKYIRIPKTKDLEMGIEGTLSYDGPVICEVKCIVDQPIIPSVTSYQRSDGTLVSSPIEDMYPFLDRNEFKQEMIVKPVDGD